MFMIKPSTLFIFVFIFLFFIDPPIDYFEQGSAWNREKFGYFILRSLYLTIVILWMSSLFKKNKDIDSPKISTSQNEKLVKSEVNNPIDNHISNKSNIISVIDEKKEFNESSLQLGSDSSISGQVKTYAFYTWMIIPATLFLPWIEIKPSDSGGSVFAVFVIGFIVFITSSFFLARKVYINKLDLSNVDKILGYSPLASALILLSMFIISFIE